MATTKKISEAKKKKAFKAFMQSEENQQTPEQKRENAWFPIHIKSVMENKDNVCYENGVKTGESLLKLFGFTVSEAWDFEMGLKLFYSGVVNGIQKAETEVANLYQKKETEPSE